MKPHFSISELEYRDDNSFEEQRRSRNIFESLKVKAREEQELSEHEKDFFCGGLRFSLLNDGVLEDYKCCDNHKFKLLYLAHFRDLTGGSPVYKPNNLLKKITEIDNHEKQADLKYLYEKSDEWEATIKKTNHKAELLKKASKKTRDELKKFSTTTAFIEGIFRHQYTKWEILLKSKYIYCVA